MLSAQLTREKSRREEKRALTEDKRGRSLIYKLPFPWPTHSI